MVFRSGKIVDLADEDDRRDKASIQMYSVWKSSDDEYPATRLTVFATGEPTDCVVWQMSRSFQSFREDVYKWEVTASDTSGCLDLISPKSVEVDTSVQRDSCPAVLFDCRLAQQGVGVH